MKNVIIKFLLIIIVLLVIPWPAYPQDIKQGPLMVLQEGEFNFGQVKEGSSITHDFVVMNLGDETLEIKKVSPG